MGKTDKLQKWPWRTAVRQRLVDFSENKKYKNEKRKK